MTDFTAFIEKYYANAAESQIADVSRFLNHFNELLKDENPADFLKNKDALCRLFYMQKLGSITRTHYQKIKEYLLKLFDWFDVDGQVPSQTEVIDSGEYICFFRDLDSALAFIDKVGENRLTNYQPLTDLITIKALFVLGWYGFSLREIAELKKSAIVVRNNDSGSVVTHGKNVVIKGNAFTVLFLLKYLESYKSLPNGRVRTFKDYEEYMFRPTNKSDSPLKEDHLVQMLRRFNAQVPFASRQNIAFRYIHVNAMFVKILEDKSDKPLLDKIINITHCSDKQAYSYRTQYLSWLKLIENNVI